MKLALERGFYFPSCEIYADAHDPFVINDPNLQNYENVLLTSDLKKATRDSDLIILSTDHQEYKKLGKKLVGNIPIYDGRALLDRNLANKLKILTIGQGELNTS